MPNITVVPVKPNHMKNKKTLLAAAVAFALASPAQAKTFTNPLLIEVARVSLYHAHCKSADDMPPEIKA